MNAREEHRAAPVHPGLNDASRGLFRSRLIGPAARTREAFAALRAAPWCVSDGARGGRYGGRFAVSSEPDEGSWEMISLRDEIFVNTSQCRYAQERIETVQAERFVEFHFVLAGDTRVRSASAQDIRIGPPTLSVVQQREGAEYTVACGPGHWRSVGLHIPRERFARFLEAALPGDTQVLRALQDTGAARPVVCEQMALGADVLQAVEQLLANPYEGYRRLVYADAKVTEILCASVDLWQAHLMQGDEAPAFSARDLRLIAQARELILADPAAVYTIPQLAQAVGTNTSKLKRGFKFVYGSTIFDFAQRFRMAHALRLLVDERRPVQEVAQAVGYRWQTSFTVAFRECYGVAPKDARRLNPAQKVPNPTPMGGFQRPGLH